MKYIYLFLLSLSSFAVAINNNDLIVVHPTTYYHSNSQTINYSNELVKQMNSVLLFQKDPRTNSKWYILRGINQTEIYSVAGRFTPEFHEEKISVSAIGGYLTNCLGRASASLISSVIDSKNVSQINLHLKTKGIFTGHLLERGVLVPLTPYEESTLDDTIDGLNLNEVLVSLSVKSAQQYLIDATRTGILRTYDLINTQNKNYEIKIFYKNRLIKSYSSVSKSAYNAAKEINIYFEDQ